ncbi:molybdate ABC transporter substrate-binding protein [Muriicola marianensis]|nr:molybdate ABC transporter substrate-binding protein [Muriicola marianensis]
MMKYFAGIFLLLFATIFLTGCREGRNHENTLRIAIASNLQYAVDSVVAGFEKEHEIICEVIPGSSGKLFAQIREGAPYDLFLSADMDYPEALFKEGRTIQKPEVFAYGALVLWTGRQNLKPSIEILASDSVRYIALANPRIAPFGRAAQETLVYYGMEEKVRDKMVYGESVAQANQFIQSGSAEVGFTSLSIVMSPAQRENGKWILIDTAAYQPLPHGAVLLQTGKPVKPAARQFYEYLFSGKGKEVLKNFGYSVHE